MIVNILKLTAKLAPVKVNPRVLEFGCHYLSGKQTDKTLTAEEVAVTKTQILGSIGNLDVELGIAHVHDALGEDQEWDWFGHPTLGVVGGFNYTVEEKEGYFLLHCVDIWDFNPGSQCDLVLNDLPIKLLKPVRWLVNHLGLSNVVKITDYGDGLFDVSVEEDALSGLNATRAFTTRWMVRLDPSDLTCPLPIRKSNRRNKFK